MKYMQLHEFSHSNAPASVITMGPLDQFITDIVWYHISKLLYMFQFCVIPYL